jgi:hypothetical protein
VYDSFKNQPGINAVSLGKHEFKNISTAVTVWTVTGSAGLPQA